MEAADLNYNVFDLYESSSSMMKEIFPDEIIMKGDNISSPTNRSSHHNILDFDVSNGYNVMADSDIDINQTCALSLSDTSTAFPDRNYLTGRNCEEIDDTNTDHNDNSFGTLQQYSLRHSSCSPFDGESLAEMQSKHLWSKLLDGAVLNDDPMMSDTCRSINKTDHCYSSADDLKSSSKPSLKRSRITSNNSLTVTTKTYRDAKTSNGSVQLQTIKQEPKIITVHTAHPMMVDSKTGSTRPAQSLLKGNQSQSRVHTVKSGRDRIVYPIMRVKSEPRSPCEEEDVYVDEMPMTPPSSNQSSDSEGAASPPTSPVRQVLVARATGYRYNPATAMYSQPIPTSGVLRLSDEEKRTFITEGYPLPAKLPLTKIEERNLKKVRRKIKNKISAQESRRKKKEYMDQLERKVDNIVKENNDLRQKCDNYECNNRTLVNQLQKLQSVLKRVTPRQVTAQTGTCLLVMILCFAVFVGNWSPLNSTWSAYGGSPCMSLNSHVADSSFSVSSQVGARTLTSLAETPYTKEEPLLIRLAKHSIQWTVNLLYNANSSSIWVTE